MSTKNSLVYNKACQFAIRVVKAYKHLCEEKKEFVLSKQLLRSGTSIGANLAEANGAISKADFKAKISIAYKECLETKYLLFSNQLTVSGQPLITDKSDRPLNFTTIAISNSLRSHFRYRSPTRSPFKR
jgi:four helix bundle protein